MLGVIKNVRRVNQVGVLRLSRHFDETRDDHSNHHKYQFIISFGLRFVGQGGLAAAAGGAYRSRFHHNYQKQKKNWIRIDVAATGNVVDTPFPPTNDFIGDDLGDFRC